MNQKVYQLKITLNDITPSIWRRVLVEPSTTLGDLHDIIQAVMPWENCHLHQFLIGKKYYGDPETDDFGCHTHEEHSLDLSSLFLMKKRRFTYEYDFGDGWEHTIEIEKVVLNDENDLIPCCIGGERACPPEDSGGPHGYLSKLEALNNPQNDETENIREWMSDFVPERFSLEATNQRLQDLFYEEVDSEDDEEVLEIFRSTCSWCLTSLDEDEILTLGVKLEPGFDLKSHRGKAIPIEVVGKEHPVLCFIPPENSPAAKEGAEALVVLCSEKCRAQLLRAVLHATPTKPGKAFVTRTTDANK